MLRFPVAILPALNEHLQPLPMTLCRFLQEHLQPVLQRCVLGITKIDLIPLASRRHLIENIRRRYSMEFELNSPKLVALSPRLIVLLQAHASPTVAEELAQYSGEHEALAQAFYEAEVELYEFLVEQREVLLVNRMVSLWESMLSALKKELADREEEFRERHDLLEQGRLPDLSGFISERRKQLRDALKKKLQMHSSHFSSQLSHFESEALASLQKHLDAAKTTMELQAIARIPLHEKCNESKAVTSQLTAKLRNELAKEAERLLRDFESEFQAFYRSLALLGASVPQFGMTCKLNQNAAASLARYSIGLKTLEQEQQKRDNLWMGGGMATGAAIGTVLLPGVGTVLGGIIGGIVGAMKSEPPIQECRIKYRLEIRQTLQKVLGELAEEGISILHQTFEELSAAVAAGIGHYLGCYKETIDRLIEEDKRQANKLQHARESINKDTRWINERLHDLAELRAALPLR